MAKKTNPLNKNFCINFNESSLIIFSKLLPIRVLKTSIYAIILLDWPVVSWSVFLRT